MKCPRCLGSGKLQDTVYTWKIVTCHICDGTGIKPDWYDKLMVERVGGKKLQKSGVK